MREKKSFLNRSLFIIAFILMAGCNQTFEPLQKNEEYYFSIYGYLDAAADTQWVRVGVPRENINETPDPTGIIVTLQHMETGQAVMMQDSLFSSKGFLNYWTTTDIENEQTYRIKAEREDGKSSQVTVNIPKELPTPIVEESYSPTARFGTSHTIYIDDSIEHLVDVQSKWYVLLQPDGLNEKIIYSFSYRNTAEHITGYGGAFIAEINVTDEQRKIEAQNAGSDIDVLHRQVVVSAGGPQWDDKISSIDDLEYFLDGTASNVENGLGYVVGIDTKWVPLRTCTTPNGSRIIACEPEKPYW